MIKCVELIVIQNNCVMGVVSYKQLSLKPRSEMLRVTVKK